MKCSICGKEEDISHWNDETQRELTRHQMCFQCNHWRNQMEEDKVRGEHNYAIVNGGHYVLMPQTNSPFQGFGGHLFKFKFKDGTVKECNNVWYQGNIREAHPYWEKMMSDNATIIQ